MTVYVDDARIPATAGGYRARWSHLTADTVEELHEFVARLPLRRSAFQERCRTRCAPVGQPCPHWHYDLTDWMRRRAIDLGARPVTVREMGALVSARRAANRDLPAG